MSDKILFRIFVAFNVLVLIFYLLQPSKSTPITIPTPFKSSITQVPTMRKVLQMENIRVYQYSDSLGTTTIFASEFDFLSNTSNQVK